MLSIRAVVFNRTVLPWILCLLGTAALYFLLETLDFPFFASPVVTITPH
ncbi:hypothetical protein [Thermoactinomyces mirandus]|nr:hypothetical protein [Thermoactinomyces mirandus]